MRHLCYWLDFALPHCCIIDVTHSKVRHLSQDHLVPPNLSMENKLKQKFISGNGVRGLDIMNPVEKRYIDRILLYMLFKERPDMSALYSLHSGTANGTVYYTLV